MKKLEDENKIIERVKRGDKKAFEPIVKFYMKRAYNIALGFVHNEQDALDISQEAFIKAFRGLKKFDTKKDFFPYFYQIIKRLCFDYTKKRKREGFKTNNFFNVVYNPNGNNRFKEALSEAINNLEPEQKELIILRYIEGFSYEELSRLLGKPIGTIMSSLFYIKKKLKEELEGGV